MAFQKKLLEPRIWKRILCERLTEPLHLNLLSVLVGLFGTYRQKIAFDLVLRPHNAFGILKAADQARAMGLSKLTIVEFGVAAGAGLMNMCAIARKVSALTGVDISVVGFDTGQGMPPARDYRDHPELYHEGDFPSNLDALKSHLPPNCRLVLGNVAETVPQFLQTRATPDAPFGYVVVDVDYYSSTVDALKLFQAEPRLYLPLAFVYLDDVHLDSHNPFAGELLAVNEFNAQSRFRKICQHDFLENRRVFRRADWIKRVFYLHVMDHPARSVVTKGTPQLLTNPYLD